MNDSQQGVELNDGSKCYPFKNPMVQQLLSQKKKTSESIDSEGVLSDSKPSRKPPIRLLKGNINSRGITHIFSYEIVTFLCSLEKKPRISTRKSTKKSKSMKKSRELDEEGLPGQHSTTLPPFKWAHS